MHSSSMYGLRQRLVWALADFRSARLSLGLAGGLVLLEILLQAAGGTEGAAWIYRAFGLSREGMLEGRLWQVASYACIHGGWLHAGLNAVFLILAGSRVERIGGSVVLGRVFAAGVVSGGAFHLLIPGGGPESLLIGASGGISALVLWLTTLSPQSRMWPVPLSAKNLGIGLLLASGLLAVATPWLPDGGSSIGHACHFGGALAGWLMARHLLRPRITLAALKRERARRESEGRPLVK